MGFFSATYFGGVGCSHVINETPIQPPALASDEYLERYLSSYGIDSFADHYDTDSSVAIASVLRDCKIYAGGLLAGKLAQRYLYSQLINVPMMEEVWAVIVLRTLCYRRGNPPPASLEFRYQEYMQKDGLIDLIARGIFSLTDANGNPIRPKNSNIPAHSNLMVDRRYAESQIRVWSGSSDRSASALGRKFDRHNEYGE